MVDSRFTVGASDTYEQKIWSSALYTDTIMSEPLIQELLSDGVITRKDDLSRANGGRVQFNYVHRLNGKGIIGDTASARAAAANIRYDNQEIAINELSKSVISKTDGSISQQRTPFSLTEENVPQVVDWYKQRFIVSAMYQLGGFDATSLTFDGSTYTGDERLELTGMNAASAPTANRSVWANNQTTDNGVNGDTSATLTLQLFDDARKKAMTQTADKMNFKAISGKPYDYVALVSTSGMTQLLQQAQSNGNLTISQMILSRLAGGGNSVDLPPMIYNKTKLVEVPDHYMPRGVNSGSSLANTHRFMFCGEGALKLCFGKGYSDQTGTVPGFNIASDVDVIDKYIITNITSLFGMEKCTVNSEDVSVVTGAHYVA